MIRPASRSILADMLSKPVAFDLQSLDSKENTSSESVSLSLKQSSLLFHLKEPFESISLMLGVFWFLEVISLIKLQVFFMFLSFSWKADL